MKYLVNTHYTLATMCGTGDTVVNKIDRNPCLVLLLIYNGSSIKTCTTMSDGNQDYEVK